MVSPSPLIGTIHGKIVELDRAPGLPDGTRVKVEIDEPVTAASLESLRRAFGGWAGDDEAGLDEFLVQMRDGRHIGSRPDPSQ